MCMYICTGESIQDFQYIVNTTKSYQKDLIKLDGNDASSILDTLKFRRNMRCVMLIHRSF